MEPSPIERKIRAQLPIIRFFQVYMPLALSRWLIKQGMSHARLAETVERITTSADGVPGEWLIPQNSPKDRVLLYLHGGGFVYGLTPPHLQMVAYLAQKMGIRALAVDYRLAPDFPFPAALEDCLTAYRWLLKQGFAAQHIVLAGDSAGGNLTLTTLMKLRDFASQGAAGDPLPAAIGSDLPAAIGSDLPAAAACLSPVIDLSENNGRSKDFKDPLLPPQSTRFYNQAYVAHSDPHDPLISPAFGDWHGLPPLLVHAGEDEMLRVDAVRLEALAKSAGVDVRLEIYPRMWHVWQINLALPQAVQSLDDIAQFLKSHSVQHI